MTMAEATATETLTETFRASMRVFAGTVCLLTARDAQGGFHGMAVSSAGSLSMDPPSMMVAVNRGTSIHPVISQTGFFCLNLLMQRHAPLLERFSRSSRSWTRSTTCRSPALAQSGPQPKLKSVCSATRRTIQQRKLHCGIDRIRAART